MVEYGLLAAHSAGMTMASAGGLAWWKVVVPLAVLVGFFLLSRGLVVGAVLSGLAGIVLAPALPVLSSGGVPRYGSHGLPGRAALLSAPVQGC
jgi:hypothetical protein